MPIALKRRYPKLASTSCLAWCGLAALGLVLGSSGIQNAAADVDTRTISMHHLHTDEDITITYKRNGKYDDEALKKLNHFLRDWRRNEEVRMDPRLIDIVWEVWQDTGAKTPVSIVCGYRAPATNNMLRRRSKGVAKNSQHTLGHAMDFFIPGASLEQMRAAGLRLQRGGVGYYPTSGSPFVHLDTGSIRHWPRMTHDQLARVFPDGRTVHIPSDGKPLKNYELALADVERRGSEPSQNSLLAAREAGVAIDSARKQKNLLAALFKGGKGEDDDDEPTASVAPANRSTVAAIAVKPETVRKDTPQETPRVAAVPLPAQRPAKAIEVASIARTAPEAPAKAVVTAAAVVPTANSVVASRGAWDEASSLRQIGNPAQLQIASLASEPQVTGYTTMAYATAEKAAPVKPVSQGLHFTRRANASELTSEFTKTAALTPSAPAPVAAVPAPPAPAKATTAPRVEDIWLRAVMLAPDLQHYLSATLIGTTDPKELRPLMQKPKTALVMSFSDDPMSGMLPDQFSGEAVVFLETVNFSTRTAALR
ncbi:MAG: DUF882 domain-containing protein [Xanthobacteraceae bacterium]